MKLAQIIIKPLLLVQILMMSPLSAFAWQEHFQCVATSQGRPEIPFYGYAAISPDLAKKTALATCTFVFGSTCILHCWSIENR